jgi:hypothetical protein
LISAKAPQMLGAYLAISDDVYVSRATTCGNGLACPLGRSAVAVVINAHQAGAERAQLCSA